MVYKLRLAYFLTYYESVERESCLRYARLSLYYASRKEEKHNGIQA